MATTGSLYARVLPEDFEEKEGRIYANASLVNRSKKVDRTLRENKRSVISEKRSVSYPKWLFTAGNVLFYSAPFMVMGALIAGIALLTALPLFEHTRLVCRRDGEFNLNSLGIDDYSPWALSETFAINLAFGPTPFATAKLVDIMWDLAVGRGGQCLLGVISYRVSTQALSRILQSGSVSYNTFEALTLRNGQVSALVMLIRDFSRNASIRSRLIIFWIILSAVFVMVFPTWVSAMTGYDAMVEATVSMGNGSFTPAQDFQPVFYFIRDGSRLGSGFYDNFTVVDDRKGDPVLLDVGSLMDLTSPTEVPDLARLGYRMGCSPYAPGKRDPRSGEIKVTWNPELVNHTACDLLWHMSEYTYKYGFLGLNKTSSIFHFGGRNISLESPVLNVEAVYFSSTSFSNATIRDKANYSVFHWAILPYGLTWQNKMSNDSNVGLPFAPRFSALFAAQNIVLTDRQMNQQGQCQQQGPGTQGPISYRWGFSFQLLLSCMTLLLLWTIGMYSLHMDTLLYLQSDILKRGMGFQRAVLDLSHVYSEQVSIYRLRLYSDKRLKDTIGNQDISYQDFCHEDHSTSRLDNFVSWYHRGGDRKIFSDFWFDRLGWKERLDKDRVWLMTIGIAILLCALSWFIGVVMYVWCPFVSFLPAVGITLAYSLARRRIIWLSITIVMLVIFIPVDVWWMIYQARNTKGGYWIWGYVPSFSWQIEIIAST